MTLRTTVIAVLATTLMAGAAFARVPVVAKLEAPQAERTRVIANGAVWQCEGDSCTAVMTRAVNARSCGELAEKVGRIVSFSGDDRAVTGADLDRCNANAPQLPATTSAAR
jgi:hypothetical protein